MHVKCVALESLSALHDMLGLVQACRALKGGICSEALPIFACLEARYNTQPCMQLIAGRFAALKPQPATLWFGCADFFHAAIHTPLYAVLAVIAVIYTSTFFFFGLLWWSILRWVINVSCTYCIVKSAVTSSYPACPCSGAM